MYVLLCMILCSCGSADTEESPVELSFVAETDIGTEIEELLKNYFDAVASKDHDAVALYTTEDFIWNYDQTGFMEYSRYIASAEVLDADTGHITVAEGEYTIPVSYVLNYDSPYIDENGESQSSGQYTINANFIIIKTEDAYKITAVSDRAMG